MLQTLEMPANNFFQNKEIIYIVYPAGTAGDLLSLYISIQKNAKYTFDGIDRTGRVVFLDSTNFCFKNPSFSKILQKGKFNYAKLIKNKNLLDNLGLEQEECILINSHLVNDIEKFFIDFVDVNTKVIQVSTKGDEDEYIRHLMVKEKLLLNYQEPLLLNYHEPIIERTTNFENLLEIYFEDILIDTNKILDQINNFLDVKIEIANRGIFDLWKSKQPNSVKQAIKEIYGVDYG